MALAPLPLTSPPPPLCAVSVIAPLVDIGAGGFLLFLAAYLKAEPGDDEYEYLFPLAGGLALGASAVYGVRNVYQCFAGEDGSGAPPSASYATAAEHADAHARLDGAAPLVIACSAMPKGKNIHVEIVIARTGVVRNIKVFDAETHEDAACMYAVIQAIAFAESASGLVVAHTFSAR